MIYILLIIAIVLTYRAIPEQSHIRVDKPKNQIAQIDFTIKELEVYLNELHALAFKIDKRLPDYDILMYENTQLIKKYQREMAEAFRLKKDIKDKISNLP